MVEIMEMRRPTLLNPDCLDLATDECRGCGCSDYPTRPIYEIDPVNQNVLIAKGRFCDPCLEKPIDGDMIGERK